MVSPRIWLKSIQDKELLVRVHLGWSYLETDMGDCKVAELGGELFITFQVLQVKPSKFMNNENVVPKKPWYKKWWAIALFIFIGLGILGSLGKDTPTTTQVDQKTGSETVQNDQGGVKSYQQVFSFSGSGGKKSEPFIITGSRFKIKYSCTNTTLCSAMVYKPGKQITEGIIVNTTQPTADETIFYSGSGEYYIEASMMVGNFTMTVEDYK